MPNLIKQEKFSAGVFLDLLSETTDDYLYMWDIQHGTFYISENAYEDFQICKRSRAEYPTYTRLEEHTSELKSR